jgi:polyisoprenoid-binding protein YceI
MPHMTAATRTSHIILAAAALAPNAMLHAAAGDDYRLDPVHTQVSVCVSHLGYTHSCGRLHVKSGSFHFDAGDWSSAALNVTLDTASLDMGDPGWSDKVRTAFLDTTRYPEARYSSKRAEKSGDHGGVVHGALTLLGRTQPVDLQVTFNRAGRDGYTLHYIAGFSASATFKRSAFGMTRDIPDVGDQVDVRIEAEGLRDKDAQVQSSADDKEG